MRALLYLGLAALYLLHNDVWLWERDGRLLGLPVGLAYHVLFCLVVVAWMALVVRHAWPDDVDEDPTPRRPGGGER